jgi:hypothetical protein
LPPISFLLNLSIMDQSPPKRVTRSRAAGKDTASDGLKTAKIATASSKAKVTRSASTTKRKTRSEDTHDDEQQPEPEEIIEPKPRISTRGRPKKAVETEVQMDEPPVRPTRAKRAAVDAPVLETARSTRGRGTKKVDVPEEEAIVVEQPAKRVPRTRATTITKPAPKKTVKFEEPDKENFVPVEVNVKGKAKVAEPTGLRAKPVRKPAVAARTTRGRAKSVVEEENKSSPLSPKKATQMGRAREIASDDELASNEKTPLKPLMKSPIKPPGSAFGTAKKLDFSSTITAHKAVISSNQELRGSVLASPARRPPQSPFKESMKASSQKSGLGGSILQSPFKPSLPAPKATSTDSPFKTSLLQSPARRPQSPIKIIETSSPSRSSNTNSMLAGTPTASKFKISRFATPRTITNSPVKAGQMLPPGPLGASSTANSVVISTSTNEALSVEPSLTFSGRLSSIIPRDADPAFARDDVQETTVDVSRDFETTQVTEPMVVDEPHDMAEDQIDTIVVDEMDTKTTIPPCSPPRQSTGFAGAFGLRNIDEDPFHDSDSEDELASVSPRYSPGPLSGFRVSSHDFASSPSTPTPSTAVSKTPQTAVQRSERREKIGFTPLARQLSDWMAASPAKSESNASDAGPISPSTITFAQAIEADVAASAQPSPAKSTFFEDEMSVRDELAAEPEPLSMETDLLVENFEPVEIDEEDMALAYEADEMSLLEPDQIEAPSPENMFNAPEPDAPADHQEDENQDNLAEITPSEASQEYGDENAIAIDPALLALSEVRQPSTPRALPTPRRVLLERVCHTVSKVPLKPAAEHTPMRPSPLKRSASISRLPSQRPTTSLTRKNTVISYSLTRNTPRAQKMEQNEDTKMQDTFATPSKAEGVAWSTMGTPARTPRHDLNTTLLKGAVVFVDVHTSEGADASALFTELLTQMGARCVKSWSWNGNSEDSGKVGITHLVFKDGGKRTLEKAKETNGVVSCVGVGWVLE